MSGEWKASPRPQVLVFHGVLSSFGHDAPEDKEGNVVPGEPNKMTYLTIKFSPPEDEFSELGDESDPLGEKRPHATLNLYNVTLPEVEKALLYGRAKISVEFEEAPNE